MRGRGPRRWGVSAPRARRRAIELVRPGRAALVPLAAARAKLGGEHVLLARGELAPPARARLPPAARSMRAPSSRRHTAVELGLRAHTELVPLDVRGLALLPRSPPLASSTERPARGMV